MGAGFTDHDLVFSKVTGEPRNPERFSREFDRRVERWSLPKPTIHGLRHTWATLALKAGIHPKLVQEWLGHANVGITLDNYSHATPAMQSKAPRPGPATSLARIVSRRALGAEIGSDLDFFGVGGGT